MIIVYPFKRALIVNPFRPLGSYRLRTSLLLIRTVCPFASTGYIVCVVVSSLDGREGFDSHCVSASIGELKVALITIIMQFLELPVLLLVFQLLRRILFQLIHWGHFKRFCLRLLIVILLILRLLLGLLLLLFRFLFLLLPALPLLLLQLLFLLGTLYVRVMRYVISSSPVILPRRMRFLKEEMDLVSFLGYSHHSPLLS